MKTIFYLALMFSSVSCKSKLYDIYERQLQTKEEYILVNKAEIKNAISERNDLYYMGSDSNFHYFKTYNTSFPAKFCLKFKIDKKELNISEKIFDDDTIYDFTKEKFE